tara:strand:+ start:922 stop:1203 length:282 start_codon:yes stop_codon:yes gene_type:complete
MPTLKPPQTVSVLLERTVYVEVHVEVQPGYRATWWEPGLEDEANVVGHHIDVDYDSKEWLELTPEETKRAVVAALKEPLPCETADEYESADLF